MKVSGVDDGHVLTANSHLAHPDFFGDMESAAPRQNVGSLDHKSAGDVEPAVFPHVAVRADLDGAAPELDQYAIADMRTGSYRDPVLRASRELHANPPADPGFRVDHEFDRRSRGRRLPPDPEEPQPQPQLKFCSLDEPPDRAHSTDVNEIGSRDSPCTLRLRESQRMSAGKTLLSTLDRWTRGARVRAGTTNFLLGSQGTSDRILSRIYFEAASREWGGFATQEDHLAPFLRGLDALPAETFARILDLGTGAGGSAGLLADRFTDSSIVGLDRSRRMIREARKRFTQSNLRFEIGDAVSLDQGSAQFDLVTAHNFIPHPPHVSRVLAPRGYFVGSGTYQPLSDVSRGVWESAGFESVAREPVGDGSFDVYRKA